MISETVMDGVGKNIVDLITHLDQDLFELHILHSSQRVDIHFQKAQEMLKGQVHFYEVNHFTRDISLLKDCSAFFHIRKHIKSIQPDIVHCHSSKAGVLGRFAAYTCNIKHIYYTPHAYAIQNMTIGVCKKVIYLTIEKLFAKFFTTTTINVSEGEKQFARDHHIAKAESLKVIYNCIDEKCEVTQNRDTLKESLGLAKDQIVIGCVARIYRQKNPFLFMEIAKRVLVKHPHSVFVWIGDGEQRVQMEQYSAEHNLQKGILLLGFQEEINNYLNMMDLYLSTSLYEGLPYTLIEALRSKLPIVASDVIGNNEIVTQGLNGFLFDLDDIDLAVSCISRLIQDQALRIALGAKAYDYFLNRFSIDKMIASYEALYLQREG